MAKEKKPVERVIYDNYDLSVNEDDAREFLKEQGNEDPSDNEVWEQIYFEDELNWDQESSDMENVFDKGKFLAVGTCGLWHGTYDGGFVFGSFRELMDHLRDCEYFRFWDENGHFYVKASHHDGTHHLEIRELTDKGKRYLENWEFDWTRSAKEVHTKLFRDSHYSRLIHYAHNEWGCPKVAYEKTEVKR